MSGLDSRTPMHDALYDCIAPQNSKHLIYVHEYMPGLRPVRRFSDRYGYIREAPKGFITTIYISSKKKGGGIEFPLPEYCR